MRYLSIILILIAIGRPAAQEPPPEKEAAAQGYVIENPGTITFKVGVTIKGKVEKPQVMIFLPKERPVHQPVQFTRSFSDEIMRPLPFEPILE